MVDAIYMIPGKGTEVAVEPGKSLVLALNAKNHTEANSASFDLSKADYEFMMRVQIHASQTMTMPEFLIWINGIAVHVPISLCITVVSILMPLPVCMAIRRSISKRILTMPAM